MFEQSVAVASIQHGAHRRLCNIAWKYRLDAATHAAAVLYVKAHSVVSAPREIRESTALVAQWDACQSPYGTRMLGRHSER